MVVLAGCHVPGFDVPHAADRQGAQASRLWHGTQFVALAVGALVWALIGYVVLRYRRRKRAGADAVPSQRAYFVALEVVYTAIPLVIVAILFAYTTTAQRRMMAISSHPDLRVEVTAFQWGWRFHYPDGDVTVAGQGPTAPSERATEGPGGGSGPAERGTQGVVPPQMVLPVGLTTEIDLTATDVVHAFYVPNFLFQRNAVPGSPTRFDITPTELGTFGGRCATFCGIRHYTMTFTVRVVSPEDYRQWLAANGTGPATGMSAGSAPATSPTTTATTNGGAPP